MSALTSFIGGIRGDHKIWGIALILCVASLLTVYSSATSMAYNKLDGDTEHYLYTQLSFILIGAVCTYVCYRLDYMLYAKLSTIIFVVCVIALIYTMFFGIELNNARRWIGIPWIGKTIQTSDFAKIGLIIYLARAIAKRQDYIKDFRTAFLPLLMPIIVICSLIAPSDFSTAAILFVTCIMMMFIGRVQLKYILALIGLGFVALGLIVIVGMAFPDHVRWETWVSRITEYFGEGGYQVRLSKMAIASGEFYGLGPGNSIQKNYLPFAYADFIYAIICEEYGIIGGIAIIFLYLGLLFRSTVMVTACPKAFGAILAYGLTMLIVIQAFANIAVSVHLVPATGLTLPLVSMGGTSLIFTFISLGIILSVSRYVQEAKLQKLDLVEIENDESNN